MTKTDNGNLRAKLALRRHFLDRYHSTPPRVLECCQGERVMWDTLLAERPVAAYVGFDKKQRSGGIGLKLDSVRYLAMRGWKHDVIDVDTYASPWKHWALILENGTTPMTVFLTLGNLTIGVSRSDLDAIGAPKWVPPGIGCKLPPLAVQHQLAKLNARWKSIEAVEAVTDDGKRHGARYFGLRIEPI